MGKKTKKEKILAKLRREKIFFEKSLSPDNQQNKGVTGKVAYVSYTPKIILPKPNSQPIQKESLYIYPTQLIRKDLTKTLLLSILTISFELALYLILEKHLSLPLKINF